MLHVIYCNIVLLWHGRIHGFVKCQILIHCVSMIVNTTPLLRDLRHHFTPQYAVQWRVIGTQLGLPTGTLDIIEHDNHYKARECCNAMLKEWLQVDTTASWEKLFTVIESPAVSVMFCKVSDEEMFKRLYYQAKHDLGTEELQLYKLIIFGPPGVGKSSLFQVLLGNNPDPVRCSTGVLYRKLVQAKVAITTLAGQSKSSWNLVSIKDEILRLRFTIKRVIDKPEQAQLPSKDIDIDSSEMKVEEKLFQLSSEVPTQIQYASTLMACYDSGGQPEFFDIMPALMTIPTGNIMVFDLSKDLHLKIQPEFYNGGKSSGLQYQAHYTTAELMKTAIANIQSSSNYDSTASSKSNTHRLLVVGTHIDKCGQTDKGKLQKKVAKIEASMCNDVLTGGAIQMVYCDRDGGIIHPISNTDHEGRDKAAQKIRTAIEHMSKYQKSYSQVPINWLLFQLEVQLTGKDYIGRSECIDIAKRCYIKENEVDYVVMYFHQLGILLHYREVSGLEDIIFCNPQWLFDQLTELIKVKYDPPPLILKVIMKGILHKEDLIVVYNKLDTKGQLNIENLLKLFTHLKIMAALPNEPDQYFIPALLNPAPADVPLQEEYGGLHNAVMSVKFKNRYFPRGMFCCLVTQLAQSDWEIQVKHAYKDLITFQIKSNDHYVILSDKNSYVSVEIHCKEESNPPGIHYGACKMLYESLEEVCKRFKMSCDFEFGFVCRDSDCKGFAGVKLQYAYSTYCYCKECRRSYPLNHNQLVWFIPPLLLKAQVLTLQQPIHATNSDIVEPSRTQQKTQASNKLNSIPDEKPEMCDLITIVIPKIKAEWEKVAYYLRYDVATVKAFKEDGCDTEKCCIKLFEDWLTSPHGVTPKTWSKLLERIKTIDSLKTASEDIEKRLKSLFKEQCS